MAERDVVSTMEKPDIREIESVISMARQDINQEHPGLALERLREIKFTVEELQGHRVWVEYPLIVAEAYIAMNEQAANDFFQDFLVRSRQVPDLPKDMLLRAHMHYGDFLSRKKRWKSALKHFEQGEQYAIMCASREQLSSISLKVIEARLALKARESGLTPEKSPECISFLRLKGAAYKRHATSTKQLFTWGLYEKIKAGECQSALYRRDGNGLKEEYFDRLLAEVDEQDVEQEDEKH